MEVQISLQSPDFVFFKYIPRSGIAGSYGGCCYFLNIFEAHSHCDYPNLQSCQECQCPLSPSSSPTPTFCLFGNSHSKQVGGEISLWFWFAFSWLLVILIIFYVSVFFEKCLFSFSDHFFLSCALCHLLFLQGLGSLIWTPRLGLGNPVLCPTPQALLLHQPEGSWGPYTLSPGMTAKQGSIWEMLCLSPTYTPGSEF